MTFELDWRGDELAKAFTEAIPTAIDEVTQSCVSTVQSLRSGRAANVESQPATGGAGVWTGTWGIFDDSLWWELFVEVGNPYRAGDNAKRRAADEHYATLPDHIRDASR